MSSESGLNFEDSIHSCSCARRRRTSLGDLKHADHRIENVDEQSQGQATDMNHVKAFLLRILQTKASGWLQISAQREKTIEETRTGLCEALLRQGQALRNTHTYWRERFCSMTEYVDNFNIEPVVISDSTRVCRRRANLESSSRTVTSAASLEDTKEAAKNAGAWAVRLAQMIEEHDQTCVEVEKGALFALDAARAARQRMDAAWVGVCPQPGGWMKKQDADFCLWHAIQRFVNTCEDVQKTQRASLSDLAKLRKRVEYREVWVDVVVGVSDDSSPPNVDASGRSRPKETMEDRQTEDGNSCADSESSVDSLEDSDDENELLTLSNTANHILSRVEGEVDVCRGDPLVDAWAPHRFLVSADTWLHLWAADATPSNPPSASVYLKQVAVKTLKVDPRVVCIASPILHEGVGFWKSLHRLFWESGTEPPQDMHSHLCIRFADKELLQDVFGEELMLVE